MSRRRRQRRMKAIQMSSCFSRRLRVPHRHMRILRILPVDSFKLFFAYASRLTPRAVNQAAVNRVMVFPDERLRQVRESHPAALNEISWYERGIWTIESMPPMAVTKEPEVLEHGMARPFILHVVRLSHLLEYGRPRKAIISLFHF